MASANFIVKAAPGTSSVPHPRLGSVPVEGMSEKRMLALWLSGSPHVTITAAGLKAYGASFTLAQSERASKEALGTPGATKGARPPREAALAPAPSAEPEAAEETGGTPASAGATPEEADERPRKRGRRGNDTPEGERPAE